MAEKVSSPQPLAVYSMVSVVIDQNGESFGISAELQSKVEDIFED
jgi:hypothetical protein